MSRGFPCKNDFAPAARLKTILMIRGFSENNYAEVFRPHPEGRCDYGWREETMTDISVALMSVQMRAGRRFFFSRING